MPTVNINNSNCAVYLHLSSGGERTRTADFHVANADQADFGGLLRPIIAGQKVIHTLANYPTQRRPRDRRAMKLVSDVPRLRVATGSRVESRHGCGVAFEVRKARFWGSCEYARNPPTQDFLLALFPVV